MTQMIEIRILYEEDFAYGEALDYIIGLLRQGFPNRYALKLKSGQKKFLPVKNLAKSGLHQFFANALDYPALFPKLAVYAETAMPGTYAVMGKEEPAFKTDSSIA